MDGPRPAPLGGLVDRIGEGEYRQLYGHLVRGMTARSMTSSSLRFQTGVVSEVAPGPSPPASARSRLRAGGREPHSTSIGVGGGRRPRSHGRPGTGQGARLLRGGPGRPGAEKSRITTVADAASSVPRSGMTGAQEGGRLPLPSQSATRGRCRANLRGFGCRAGGRPLRAVGLHYLHHDESYAFAHRNELTIHLAGGPASSERVGRGSIYMHVDDADALADEWRGAGVAFVEPEDFEYGKREGSHEDPDGNLIRFGSPLRL